MCRDYRQTPARLAWHLALRLARKAWAALLGTDGNHRTSASADPGFAVLGATPRCQSPGNSFAGRVSGSGGPFPTRIVSDSWPSGHHGDPSVLNDRGGRLPSKPIRRMGLCFWGPCSDAPSALSSDSERQTGRIPNRRSARIHLVDSGDSAPLTNAVRYLHSTLASALIARFLWTSPTERTEVLNALPP